MTGGGGAIAEELAQRLDARGYEPVLADVDAERMRAVASRLSRPATLIEADLSTTEGIAGLADRITSEHADLDLLVNNAGLVIPGDVADLTAEEIERHVVVNLLSAMQLARAAASVMRPRGRGDILGLVSMGGIIALRGSAAYSATSSACAAAPTGHNWSDDPRSSPGADDRRTDGSTTACHLPARSPAPPGGRPWPRSRRWPCSPPGAASSAGTIPSRRSPPVSSRPGPSSTAR